MNKSGQAPSMISWVIALVLFVIALAARFNVVQIGEPVATWSWIIALALLLLACRVRGL